MTDKKYNPRQIVVDLEGKHRATWKMAGSTVRGYECIYGVRDMNFSRFKDWTFCVRVPTARSDGIVVQPVYVPGKKVWAGIDRRSIVFVQASSKRFSKKVYCKVNVADTTAQKTKRGLSRGERGLLPEWFSYFRYNMRLKSTVVPTSGSDRNSQIIVMDPGDHERMIRLFFALKVWVLHEGIVVKD